MLKKLKFKFIFINMLLVGVTLLLIFSAICILTWRSESEEIERTLDRILQMGNQQNNLPQMGTDRFPVPEEIVLNREPQLGGEEEIFYVSAFSVFVSANGESLQSAEYGTGMEESVLAEAVERVLSESAEELKGDKVLGGTLRGMKLIYRVREVPGGYRIAFTSADHLYIPFKNALLISGIACSISLLIFFWVSYFLAGLAIRPIERAWTQQKQFVADASHDLKTPLTVILANANILRGHRKEPVETQLQWVESTEEEAGRMRALVDRMLELAKSEDIKERLTLCETPVSELTERIALQFEPVAFERGVEIVCDIAPDVRIRSHEDSFVRLVHILLDNGIKYSPRGEAVRVTLEAVRQNVRLTVQNRGEPIPREELPHLFERFYRTDKARSVGGYGLGLSIAKNLCEGLGGRITAESNVEHGTLFTVVLRG